MQIVHDLKNPLATIALETELLHARLDPNDREHLRLAVARIAHNVGFLDRLVTDMLDTFSFESERLELRRRPTELRTLLTHVIERVVTTAERGRVSLEAQSALIVAIDPLRIERVVVNLLTNALKYAPSPAPIVVRLERGLQLGRVSVIDAGPGLSPIEIAYVFDKYRRTPSAHSREGSGLGLYVSKTIIEAHGGRIGVEATEGGGATFFFELPTR